MIDNTHDVGEFIPRKGDWIFIDIDGTLLTSYNSRTVSINPNLKNIIREWQEKQIRVFALTARNPKGRKKSGIHTRKEVTVRQLKSIGISFSKEFPGVAVSFPDPNHHAFHEGVLFAKKTDCRQKKVVLEAFLQQAPLGERPKRIVVFDNEVGNLEDIATIPGEALKLFQFIPHKAVFKGFPGQDRKFPEKLEDMTVVKSLGGGTDSVFLLRDKEGREFVLKGGSHSEAFKLEILTDAVYIKCGAPVPDFAIYHHLPEDLAKKISLDPTGFFRLTEYIQRQNDTADKEKIPKLMGKHFVLDAFLGNVDIAAHDDQVILNEKGVLWRVDNGSTVFYRAKGKEKAYGWQVTELDTLRGPKSNLGPSYYGHLTDEEICGQAISLIEDSNEMFKTIQFFHGILQFKDFDELLNLFSERLENIKDRFAPNLPLGSSTYARAIPGYTSAGILTYTLHENTPLILLGKRIRHELWGNLGGKSDPSDRMLASTAVRETFEESMGLLYYTCDGLFESPFTDLVTKNSKYRMYYAPNPYVAPEIFNKMLKDAKGHQKEYTDFCWINVRSLIEALENPCFEVTEGQQALKVGNICLHPPLYEMLKQESALALLQEIAGNKYPKAKRQKTGILSSMGIKRITSETVLGRAAVIQELKRKIAKRNVGAFTSLPAKPDLDQTQLFLRVRLGNDYVDGNNQKNIDTFLRKFPGFTDHHKRVFSGALEEESKRPDHLVFYHATSHEFGFLYDLFTVIRKKLHLYGSEHFGIFRFFDEYFTEFSTLEEMIEHFKKTGGGNIDNYTGNYQKVGLSVNPFLFSNEKNYTSCSFKLFMDNTPSRGEKCPDARELVRELMRSLGVQSHYSEKLIQLMEECKGKKGGRLCQIFIHRNVVDQVVYPAAILGSLNPLTIQGVETISMTRMMQELHENPSAYSDYMRTLQARLLMKPEIMHNTDQVQVLNYNGLEQLDQDGEGEIGEIVDTILLEFLAQGKINSPGMFHVKPAALVHREILNMGQGLYLQEMDWGPLLRDAIKGNQIGKVRSLLERNPSVDLLEMVMDDKRLVYGKEHTIPSTTFEIARGSSVEIKRLLFCHLLRGVVSDEKADTLSHYLANFSDKEIYPAVSIAEALIQAPSSRAERLAEAAPVLCELNPGYRKGLLDLLSKAPENMFSKILEILPSIAKSSIKEPSYCIRLLLEETPAKRFDSTCDLVSRIANKQKELYRVIQSFARNVPDDRFETLCALTKIMSDKYGTSWILGSYIKELSQTPADRFERVRALISDLNEVCTDEIDFIGSIQQIVL